MLSTSAAFSLPREQKVIKVSQTKEGSLRMDNFSKPVTSDFFTKVQKEVDFPLLDVQTKYVPHVGLSPRSILAEFLYASHCTTSQYIICCLSACRFLETHRAHPCGLLVMAGHTDF